MGTATLPAKALFRKDEVASVCAISRKMVQRFLECGVFEGHCIGVAPACKRRHIRVTRASIERFLTDPARRVI